MDVSAIITRAKRLAKHQNYLQADALQDLNIVKDDFFTAIISQLQEDYNWDSWTATTVDLQTEYTFPEVASDTSGSLVIKTVAINYDGETYEDTGDLMYIPARLVDPDTLPNDWTYYKQYQLATNPIYYVADQSVFIAPVPMIGEGGASKMKLTGLRNIPDYTILTEESQMGFTVTYQEVLVKGLMYYAMLDKGVDDVTAANAYAVYTRARDDAVGKMNMRVDTSVNLQYPEWLVTNPYNVAVWLWND